MKTFLGTLHFFPSNNSHVPPEKVRIIVSALDDTLQWSFFADRLLQQTSKILLDCMRVLLLHCRGKKNEKGEGTFRNYDADPGPQVIN